MPPTATKLLISESICYKNQQLVFKCQQLENSKKIRSTWLWNNKIIPIEEIHQTFHATDIKILLGTENLENFINITSF